MDRVNRRYLHYLEVYPLVTKSITTSVLAVLNETIASLISKEHNNFINNKTLLMAVYGAFVNAPISHYCYKWLNRYIRPVNARRKLLQLVIQLLTIAPLLSTVMISYIALINNLHTKDKLKKIQVAVNQNLLRILKTSWALNIFNTLIAQKFLRQELWVVFFNFNFFILGTYQNTMLKLRLKK